MGVWDKIEEEDMSGSGNGIYFVPGKYPKLRLKESKFKSSEETYKKSDVVIFILEVLESEVPDRKPGSEIEYIIKERKKDGNQSPRGMRTHVIIDWQEPVTCCAHRPDR